MIIMIITMNHFFKARFPRKKNGFKAPMGNSGCFAPGKGSWDRVVLPNLQCMLGGFCVVFFSISIILWTLTWTTGSLTCAQMLMHAIAHRGCTDTVRECALKADTGRKISCRTGESNLRQRRAGPTLYQLSYIPELFLLSLFISISKKEKE